jgi:hypothetical protein
MAGRIKTPGAKNRLATRKLLRLVDADTDEVIAIIRWRPRGELYVEHARHVRAKVAKDHKA